MLLIAGLPAIFEGRLGRFITRQQLRNESAIKDLFYTDFSSEQVWWYSLGAALLVALVSQLLFSNAYLSVFLAGVAGFGLPGPVFNHLKQQRLLRFEEQLPTVLDQLAASTRAGLNLMQAIEEVATKGRAPASEEFGLILQNYRLGTTTRDAIAMARARLNSKPFGLVAAALIVNIEKGGNLPEALDRISGALREIWRLEQKLLTSSAEGRKSVKMLSMLPVLIFLMVSFTQPQLVETLVSDPIGWVIIAISVLIYAIALYWLKRILTIDV